MRIKKSLNVNNLRIVDSSEVPSGRVKVTKWQEIFNRIPGGKALAVTEDDVSFSALRSSLYDLQRKGQFKSLQARKVKGDDGKYWMYVVNNAEEETEQKIVLRKAKKPAEESETV